MARNSLLTLALILAAAAIAAAGCTDTPRQNQDGAAGVGGGSAGAAGHGGGGGSVAGAPDGGAGNSGAGGAAGTGVAGSAGSAGAAGGAAGTGGAAGSTGGAAGAAGSTAGGSGVGGAAAGAGGAAGATAGAGGAAGSIAGAAGSTGGTGGAGGAAGASGGLGGGTGGAGPELLPPTPAGLAVVNGDFTSTSVSLLTLSGALSRPSCVHTMTTGTGSTTISGDVTLPSQPQRGGQLVLIDRGNAALTFVDPATCTIDHQISVKGGFNFPNPHDVVVLGSSKAYVTRYERNAAAGADPAASGDDVLIVDPRNGNVRGNIPLATYAAPVAGATIQARPDRAVIAAGKVVVSLNNISGDFAAYGEGRLVVIDSTTDQVLQTVALTGLKNCEAMEYVAASKLLLVTCGGGFGAQDQVLESGIALVDMSGANATLSRVISAVAFNARPLSFQVIAATPTGTRAFVNTVGAFAGGGRPAVPDRLFMVDVAAGTTLQIATSGAFDLGAFALTGSGGQLLLPDGSVAMPRVHVYDVTAVPSETGSFLADTVSMLSPRQIARY